MVFPHLGRRAKRSQQSTGDCERSRRQGVQGGGDPRGLRPDGLAGLIPDDAPPRRATRSRAGFTLLEVILAIGILAGLAAVVAIVLDNALRTTEFTERVLQGTEVAPAVLTLIRQDLEAAFVPGAEQTYFMGTRDEVNLVTSNPVFGPSDEDDEDRFQNLSEAGYSIGRGTHGGCRMLVRRHQPWIGEEPLKGGEKMEVYEHVRELQFSYLKPGPEGEWLDEWDNAAQRALPRAVKVTIVVGPPDEEACTQHPGDRYELTVLLSP